MSKFKEYIVKEGIAGLMEKTVFVSRVQELIRCKDCKYWADYTNACKAVDPHFATTTGPDDYCSFAERRTK